MKSSKDIPVPQGLSEAFIHISESITSFVLNKNTVSSFAKNALNTLAHNMKGRRKKSTRAESLEFRRISGGTLIRRRFLDPNMRENRQDDPSRQRSRTILFLACSFPRNSILPPYQSGLSSLKPNPAKWFLRRASSSLSNSSQGD